VVVVHQPGDHAFIHELPRRGIFSETRRLKGRRKGLGIMTPALFFRRV
jgi:hypothetical protein